MRLSDRSRRGQAGFTLVELLIVLTLVSVIGGVVVSALVSSMQSTRDTQARVGAMAELQRAAENVTREVRAACPVVGPVLDDSTITAAIQRDGEQRRHTFRFDATANTLVENVQQRNASGTWITVVPDRIMLRDLVASASSFEFLDDRGQPVTLPGDVRTVKLNLSRNIPNADDVLVETAVSLRNGGRSCG